MRAIPILTLISASLMLAGCGGGGGGGGSTSGSSPETPAAITPFVGTWGVSWTQSSTNTSGQATIYFTADEAESGATDSTTSSVIGAVVAPGSVMPPIAAGQSAWKYAVAYGDHLTNNSSQTAITSLLFFFTTQQDAPEGTDLLEGTTTPTSLAPYVQMALSAGSTANTLTGNIAIDTGQSGQQLYNVTLTKQSNSVP